MSEAFVPLRAWLQPPVLDCELVAPELPGNEPVWPAELDDIPPACDDLDDALAGVRRFRAMLGEALDAAAGELCRDIALEIAGRDLALADVEIATIVRRACERYAAHEPLAVRAHPDDAAALAQAYRVVPDASLRRGDAVVEVRAGSIDATLGVRLQRLLERR
jgi:flagellar assembly protein FliH